MLKVYCDFNDSTDDNRYWVLWFNHRPLKDQIAELGLKHGDKIILYQDEDDFEVEATLLFDQEHEIFSEKLLCARPDWQTFRDL